MSDVVSPGDMQLARHATPAEVGGLQTTESHPKEKENKWKLAFRQLMFMKRMNMQFNDRTKNEIELRQQNISVSGVYFGNLEVCTKVVVST